MARMSSNLVATCVMLALLVGCSRDAAPKEAAKEAPGESLKKIVITDLKELEELKLKGFKFKENKEITNPLSGGKKTVDAVK